jgi:hypothetical protein
VTRMGGNRVSGFRRAAAFGRAIARDPSPVGARGPPKRRTMMNVSRSGGRRCCSKPSGWVDVHDLRSCSTPRISVSELYACWGLREDWE